MRHTRLERLQGLVETLLDFGQYRLRPCELFRIHRCARFLHGATHLRKRVPGIGDRAARSPGTLGLLDLRGDLREEHRHVGHRLVDPAAGTDIDVGGLANGGLGVLSALERPIERKPVVPIEYRFVGEAVGISRRGVGLGRESVGASRLGRLQRVQCIANLLVRRRGA